MGALLQHAAEVYAFVYFGLLTGVCVLEWAVPLRPQRDSVRLRWLSNFGLAILNAFIVRALFPLLGVGWAAFCADRGWGLFNLVNWPGWFAALVSIAWLDFLFYIQHFAMHRVPLLWRAHRTHHTDHDFDFSTGVRAHPTETLLTNAVTFAGIAVAGASPIAVLIYHLLTILLGFAGHANVRLPGALDRALRILLVTPDMHRVHHSVDVREGESNFSNLFPWWDYIFATYLAQPAAGHRGMEFGVRGFEARKHQSLPWMLAQPFLRPDRPDRATEPVASSVPPDASEPQRS